MISRRLLLLLVLAATGTGVAVASVVVDRSGRIGPKNRIQNNGRLLNPFGRMVGLGNFPTGGALTRDGHFFWTLSAGRGKNDIRIVQVAKVGSRRPGHVVQTIPMPGLSGGIVMAPDGHTAYVSGVAESEHKDQQTAADVPGKKGDVIHVFGYDRRTGRAVRRGIIPVPPPSDAPPYQDLPIPTPNMKLRSWPRDLAISRDGRTILAALNLADTAAIVDTKTRKARYLRVGRYPYGAAISRDGKRGFVSSETQGILTAIDLASGKKIADVTVAPRLSHPEGLASDTRSNLIFAAVTHQDNIVAVDSRTLKVVKTIHVGRPEGIGTFPTALKVTRDGCSLLAAMSGEDSVAVIALSRKRTCDRGSGRRRTRRAQPLTVVGHIPVGSYPTAVDATPARRTLVWLSARGVGTGANPHGPNPLSKSNNDDEINRFQYLPSFVRGSAGYGSFPTDIQIGNASRKVYSQLRPTDSRKPPAGTPLRAGGPIKHVFYVVKENRTYDQMLGDDPRGDGDPKLTLFGNDSTPNLHALAKRFPLLDHVYANSEASIDGHYWTSAGAVSDYVVKAWHQNYASRGRPYDFGAYEVSAPPKNYLFQRAEKEGISYFNYGEALAGVSPFPDKDRVNGSEEDRLNKTVLTKSDIGTPLPPPFCYESDLSNSTVLSAGQVQVYDSSVPLGADPGAKSRYDCFNTRLTQQLATNNVPAFNYLVLPNDHTEGTRTGRRTPRAQVASNDYGLGQIVDRISHSAIWKSSMIIVVEDDSQDGADHVDAHRIPALAISPYTRKGAVIHDRYDQISFVKSLELVVGMKPRNLAEALAVPLYSAFDSTPGNDAAYSAIRPKQSLTEKNTASSPGAAQSKSLNLGPTDNVPQHVLDGLIWKSIHGANSTPPPPGPNASGQDGEGKDGR